MLNRDKFPFRKADIDWLIGAFLDYGISLVRTAIADEIFIDKDDIVFYEVALSKEDSFLVTGNIRHFPKKPFIVTPAEMLTIIDVMEVGPGRILNEPVAWYGRY